MLQYLVAPADTSLSSDLVNPIDRQTLNWVKTKSKRLQSARLASTIGAGVLAMSDQQLVTGIAVLISGYSQLHCSISLFHRHIIVYLTWFSSLTHLSTLTFLQRYMHDHKRVLYLRLPLMAALACMLFVALVPTGNSWCQTRPAVPASCCFQQNLRDYVADIDEYFGATVTSQVLLVGGFISQTIKSFLWSSSFTRLWLREKPGAVFEGIGYWSDKQIQSFTGWRRRVFLLLTSLVVSLLITFRTFLDLVCSALWELMWLSLSLAWGTLRLFEIQTDPVAGTRALEDDYWGFGQWVPVSLLLIPVVSTVEAYLGKHGAFFSCAATC
ncbi:hypothetical protein BJX61DRAFT_132677 [Aspergillus egyptiacus]|nr:hypothetical protein BJX61DRAFT_132677 [Aspergillus egyptiacus]